MRSLGVVTVGRSDYGIYSSILKRIHEDPELKLMLFAAGMHLSPRHGSTIKMIEADGYIPAARVEMIPENDTPRDIVHAIARGLQGFSDVFFHTAPDILVVLGDRFEMYSAALAALPFTIPVAHIHGGELTQGAIDDALRHSMTKLSHLHFVSTQEYANRVMQLGEAPWRITVAGAPGLDELEKFIPMDRADLENKIGLPLNGALLMITYHPETLDYEHAGEQIDHVLKALDKLALPVLFTLPNADTGGLEIARRIRLFLAQHPNARLMENLGTQLYFSLMTQAAVMVGNSSSGIIEAPSFELPVVNIGTRQSGRVRASNVIDVQCKSDDILAGIQKALKPAFKQSLKGLHNPYRSGNAATIIVDTLKEIPLNRRLLVKEFYDELEVIH
jgi:UDP-hydrolysing UDP-N-acetyl-D-glucosamine 2-epimerase